VRIQTARATFDSLRNSAPKSESTPGTAGMVVGMSSMPSTGLFKDWMDFSLLPPFDKISKYFGISVYTVSSTPDGIVLKIYAPVPTGLRK